MGHSNWSDDAYQSRQSSRSANKQTAFTYDKQVRQSGVTKAHDEMNPFGKIRESRDSVDHPESLAIAVVFDVTGSMGMVPRVLQTKLGSLMRVLIQKGYVEHPQILFGAIGDAFTDQVPLQIGQFESGLEMDDDLGKIYLEGGGGGQVYESYELTLYFMARHTTIDCFEQRGRKGYLFTIGDEKPYPYVRKEQVQQHIGDTLEQDIPIEQIVAEVQAKYECFHIVPAKTTHGSKPEIQKRWRQLFGERVLLLDDEAAVCETIALAIGLCEGTIDSLDMGKADLVAAGADADAVASATTALSPYAAARPKALPLASGPMLTFGPSGNDGRL